MMGDQIETVETSRTVQKKTMKCILIATDSRKDLRICGTRAPLRRCWLVKVNFAAKIRWTK
jgi:hypothetical protein